MNRFEIKTAGKNFAEFPLLWFALALIGGILAAQLIAVGRFVWLILLFIAAVAAISFLIKRRLAASAIFVMSAFVAAGAMLAAIENSSVAANRICRLYDAGQFDFQTPVEITGTLSNAPEETPNGYFLIVRADEIQFKNQTQTASGAVRFFLALNDETARQNYQNLELRYGARVKIYARLTRENRYRNAGGADFRQILQSKELDAAGTIKSPLLIERLDDVPVFLPLAKLYEWRADLIKNFKRHFSLAVTGVMAASLLNNRYFLDKPTAERFREGGTFHVLVISGVHITFLGFLMSWIVGKLTKNFVWQFVWANSLLWTFSLTVGAETPVVRAALMFTIYHAARLFYRESGALNALGATLLILLVWRPSDLFDQSFQLTFVSVAAIVTTAFPLLEKMRKIGEWQPNEKTPIPPDCSKWLKNLSESLFWSEQKWRRAQKRSLWKAVLFKSELPEKLEKRHLQFVWQIVFASMLVSVIVTVWLLPLMAVYFHRLSFAGLLLNVVVGFLIAVETFLAIVALLVAQISPFLAEPLIAWTELLNFLLTYSAEPFINSNFASIRLPIYSGAAQIVYLLYFLPLIGLAIVVHRWNAFQLTRAEKRLSTNKMIFGGLLAAQFLFLLIVILHPFSAAQSGGVLRVDFLDVGQGDAALITTPHNFKILVDGGGRPNFSARMDNESSGEFFEPDAPSVGETVVSEFLWEKGFGKVDFLLPSHADLDHIDGLNDVAKNFAVDAALVGRNPPQDLEFRRFSDILQRRDIPISRFARGDSFEIDGVKFEILSPVSDSNPDAVSDNNNSVVFRLIYGKHRFLFTGDIEAKAENELLQNAAMLDSEVVKVAHHGSKTSSTEKFINAANAQFAVISVSRESPYGHPNREVVERWQNSGAKTLTTGGNGTITFVSNGETLEMKTFVDGK